MNDNSTLNQNGHLKYLKSILKMSKKEAGAHYLDVCQFNCQEYFESEVGNGWLIEFEGNYSDLDIYEKEYIHSFDKYRQHLMNEIERYTNE